MIADMRNATKQKQPHTILIVEDEPTLAAAIAQRLASEGWAARVAGDGASAVTAARQLRPDLVIMDIMLPIMDGLEATKRIVAEHPVPVMILTARDDESDKVIGLGIGADDYMTKPFETKELVARVKAVLRRSDVKEQTADKELVFPKLTVNLSNYEIRIDGKLTEIPPKELELLYFLASNPNRVFTREQLLEEVWGFDYFGDSRTVDVHIKRLREKLEGIDANWQLKTVWGVGYKFEVR